MNSIPRIRPANDWFQWPRMRYRANVMVWLLRFCLAKSSRQWSFRQNSLLPSAVGMNCEVEFRDNIKKAVKHLRIGFHGEEDRGRHGVSVLTPIGAALVERRLNRLVHACKG